MCPANERRRYNKTTSLIGWAHTKTEPWFRDAMSQDVTCQTFGLEANALGSLFQPVPCIGRAHYLSPYPALGGLIISARTLHWEGSLFHPVPCIGRVHYFSPYPALGGFIISACTLHWEGSLFQPVPRIGRAHYFSPYQHAESPLFCTVCPTFILKHVINMFVDIQIHSKKMHWRFNTSAIFFITVTSK